VRATRVLRTVVSSATLAVVASSFIQCGEQPKPSCITFVAGFAFRLIPQGMPVESAPGACANFGPAGFNADPEAGVLSYYEKDDKGQPNYDKGSVAIQTQEIAGLVATAHEHGVENTGDGKLYSFGPYSGGRPDDNDFCTVPTLSPTHIVLAEVPPVVDDPATMEDETFPGQPAQDITLTWSSLRVYVTAASFGTQLEVMLQDKRLTPAGDSCTYTYRALGLGPGVPCAKLDDNGDPVTDPTTGTTQTDVSACDPQPNTAAGRPLGSGISVNTNYDCDSETLFCTLKGDTVPALR
jgi:hypothetical protein